jgi:small conductance mechanosensitive channel
MDQMIASWYQTTIRFLPNLILIAIILALTIVISRRTQGLVRRFSERTQAPPEIVDLLGRVGRFFVLAVGLLLVLGRLGLSDAVISFVAGLGIAGIVIGFALQDIFKQFAAGILLLMLRPFRIGDEVKIGAFEGRVVQIQLRATVLKTRDGDEVLIPNADVYTTAIVNASRYDLRRHTLMVNVSPETDLGRTRSQLTQALGAVPGIAANPAAAVIATGFDGQSVKLEVRFWIDERAHTPDTVTTGLIAAIRRALEQPEGDGAAGRLGDRAME